MPDWLRHNGLAVLGVMTWAAAFPCTEVLLRDFHPVLNVAGRMSVGAAFMMAWVIARGKLPELSRIDLRGGFLLGVCGLGVAQQSLMWGQNFSNAVSAAIIATLMPLVSILMGVAEGNERFTLRLSLALVLAIAGGVYASGVGASGASFKGGEVLVLVGITAYTWYSRRAVQWFGQVDAIARVAAVMTAGALAQCTIAISMVLGGRVPTPTTDVLSGLPWLLGLAIVAGGISNVLWQRAVQALGATLASMHLNAAPFYVMLAMIPLGGLAGWRQVIGALLVFGATFVAQVKFKRAKVAT